MAAEAAGVAQRRQTQHPPTLQMIKEALQAHDEKKGASVVAIKRFILVKYPSVDPIRLKYLLKRALSKGLSCGDLVRPQNSSAVGATGTFKLARKKPQLKQQLGQADPARRQAQKPGQKGTTEALQAPVAGARQRGATEQQPSATRQKPKAKPLNAQPRAAKKPRSDRAKHPKTAVWPQAHDTGSSGAPRAAGHHQAPQKGHSGRSTALAGNAGGSESDSDSPASARVKGPQKAPRGKSKVKVLKGAQQDASTILAAENAGESDSDSSTRAGAKQPQKAPRGKGKGKMPKRAQQDAPKEQGGQDQAKRLRVTPGAAQGKARLKKSVLVAADRKAS